MATRPTSSPVRRFEVVPIRPNYSAVEPALGWRLEHDAERHEVLIPCYGPFSPYALRFKVDGFPVRGRRLFLRPVRDRFQVGGQTAELIRTMSWEPLGRAYQPRRMLRAFLLLLAVAVPVAILTQSVGIAAGLGAAVAVGGGSTRRVKAALELVVDGTSAGSWITLATSVQNLSRIDFTFDRAQDAIGRSWAAEYERAAHRRALAGRVASDYDIPGLEAHRSLRRAYDGHLIATWPALDDAGLATFLGAVARWPAERTAGISRAPRRAFDLSLKVDRDGLPAVVSGRIPHGKGRPELESVGWVVEPDRETGTPYYVRRFEASEGGELGALLTEGVQAAYRAVYGARLEGAPWSVGAT
jgi:hypothetical protein